MSESPDQQQQVYVDDGNALFIVGIGASAGGLEALEELFAGMPVDTGMAFVVVQHLAPDFKSVMKELLGRFTSLEILVAQSGMEVRANRIYLLPPGAELTISDGRLVIAERVRSQGLFLPIDTFLDSLASDAGSRAIAVILSGTGSDGSRGIVAVHQADGLVIVQSPESAQFNGMPRSAIATDVVDFVLMPAEIRNVLVRRSESAKDERMPLDRESTPETDATARIVELLHRDSQLDFSQYKTLTVMRRIERRMVLCQATSIPEYVTRLARDPQERSALYRDLLIGVTSFFRDPEAFACLEATVLPALMDALEPDAELRIWVAGCATGEEAYSMAMMVHEAFRRRDLPCRARIFATDVHPQSIEIASAGIYPAAALGDVRAELRERYFTSAGERDVQVSPDLRGIVVFAPHNLLRDSPFTRIDLVTCRNLLIYLKPPAQHKVLMLLHFALRTGGILFLGPSESTGLIAKEFAAVDSRWKIYRKLRDIRIRTGLPGPLHAESGAWPEQCLSQRERFVASAERLLRERFAPPSWLLSEDLSCVHTFNGGARFLVPRDGGLSLKISDLLEGELKTAVAGALKRARDRHGRVVLSSVQARTQLGAEHIELVVEPLGGPGEPRGFVVALVPAVEAPAALPAASDTPDDLLAPTARERMNALELELRHSRESLQATIEEMETANEELQATNEELVAANEELQSTNEELQSVNQELYTVNAEHQSKITELTELTSDVNHLLEATQVHTIFLDRDLRIRKFTPKIGETFRLLPQDIGRRIDNFTHELEDTLLMADLAGVLGGKSVIEREVRHHQGQWYLLRILPYRPRDTIEGVVLTLVDVSRLKATENELRTSEERYRTLVRAVNAILWTTDENGRFASPQPEWEEYTGQTWEEHHGSGWLNAVHVDDREQVQRLWAAAMQSGELYEVYSRIWSREHKAYRRALCRAAPVMDEQGRVREWVGNTEDIEETKRAEALLREREAELQAIVDHSPVAIYVKDVGGAYRRANLMTRRLLGAAAQQDVVGKTDYDFLSSEEADVLRAHDLQVLRTGEALEFEEQATSGSELKTLLSVKFPLIGDDAQIYAVAGVSSDISDRKTAQERDRHAIEQRDRFITMMSHELRNPLSAIRNALLLLDPNGPNGSNAPRQQGGPREQGGPSGQNGQYEPRVQDRHNARNPGTAQALAIIGRQAKHMSRLLDDLLDTSRIRRGQMEMRREILDLVALARSVVETIQPFMAQKSQTLHVTMASEPLLVHGDPARLEQVMINILRNAHQFTATGGGIWLEIAHLGGNAVIRVRDQGVGLLPGEEERVFEMFYQRDTSIDRAQGGLGIGLWLARQIARLHSGDIVARSPGRNRGSEFEVTLPLAAQEGTSAGAILERNGRSRATLRIGIVEDNDDSREMLKLYLESLGHHVLAAPDGRSGLDMILRERPDLSIVDIGLPGLSGYEVARRVRESHDGSALHLVALTGYGRAEDRKAALAAGFDEHLVKPLDIEVLTRLTTSISQA